MKYIRILLSTALLIVFGLSTNAQVKVEGVDINELDIEFCQLMGYNKSLFGQKIIITIDYGQKHKAFQSQLITGLDEKAKVFNSVVDALNFMSKNGWEYVSNFAVSQSTGSAVYNYLLRRKKD